MNLSARLLACVLLLIGTETFAQAPIRLEFVIWSNNPAHLEVLNAIASSYGAQRPGVSVVFTPVLPYAAFPREIAIRVTASNPPDASWMLERFAPQFIAANALVDLREAAARYGFDDFAKSALTLWRRGRAVFGLPFSTSPFFMLYNKDLFSAAGVQTPPELMRNGQWTWTEFQKVARIIKEKTGRYAYSYLMDDDAIFALTPFIRAFGGDVWDAQGRCGFLSAQTIQGMRLLQRMIAVDKTIVPSQDKGDFFSGEVAMSIAQLSMVNGLQGATFSWDVAPLPGGPAGNVRLIGQAGAVVYKGGRNEADAADFVGYLTDRENEVRLSEFFPPARLSVLGSRAFLDANPLISAAQMHLAVEESIIGGRLLPAHRNYGKIEPIVRHYLTDLLSENAHVARVAADICRSINGLLGK